MSTSNQPSREARSLKPVPDTEEVTFGTWLRRQRELREISLREIADVTKISIRYLEALERDRFEILPAPVFARGFLREYARYVGLDPDEVVNSYISVQKPAEPEEEIAGPRRRRSSRLERSSNLFRVVVVIVALGVVAAIAFYVQTRPNELDREFAPTPAAEVSTPDHDGSSTDIERPGSSARAESTHRVTIDFTGDCWIEAVVDSDRRISELHVAGESFQVEAREKVVLTLDRPDAVQIEVDDQPFPVETDPSAIPTVIEIDLTATRAEGQQVL